VNCRALAVGRGANRPREIHRDRTPRTLPAKLAARARRDHRDPAVGIRSHRSLSEACAEAASATHTRRCTSSADTSSPASIARQPRAQALRFSIEPRHVCPRAPRDALQRANVFAVRCANPRPNPGNRCGSRPRTAYDLSFPRLPAECAEKSCRPPCHNRRRPCARINDRKSAGNNGMGVELKCRCIPRKSRSSRGDATANKSPSLGFFMIRFVMMALYYGRGVAHGVPHEWVDLPHRHLPRRPRRAPASIVSPRAALQSAEAASCESSSRRGQRLLAPPGSSLGVALALRAAGVVFRLVIARDVSVVSGVVTLPCCRTVSGENRVGGGRRRPMSRIMSRISHWSCFQLTSSRNRDLREKGRTEWTFSIYGLCGGTFSSPLFFFRFRLLLDGIRPLPG